ncbi:MAG: hypothetical protein KAG56_01870 [Sulfurovaceae bacterium]|nr:hypothetical protein [Sulfurovaceae bacterium]
MGNKTNENNEDIIIEDIDLIDNLIEEVAEEKPVSKNAHAKKLIDDSRELIATIDSDVSETKNVVAQNISTLKESKVELTNSTIAHSRILLAKVNHPYTQDDDFTPFEVEMRTSPEKVAVKSIGSGWFTGFILAILGVIITALTWLFVSSKLTGEVFLLDKMPTDALFSWMGGNPQVGMGVIAVSSLLIGYLIYKLKTSMKQNKNLKSANSTFEQSSIYVSTQKEAKSEIIRVDEHIKVVTPLIRNYKVLLDEQNAKLERIIHIEGELENHAQYQRTSQEVMEDTEKLMESVERLISTSITQEGRLNEFSQNALIDTKVLYESYLSKLYA